MPGDTANLCIGQGELWVTPLQMAVMTAAIANGGKVLEPRSVDRIEPQNPDAGEATVRFPPAKFETSCGWIREISRSSATPCCSTSTHRDAAGPD